MDIELMENKTSNMERKATVMSPERIRELNDKMENQNGILLSKD